MVFNRKTEGGVPKKVRGSSLTPRIKGLIKKGGRDPIAHIDTQWFKEIINDRFGDPKRSSPIGGNHCAAAMGITGPQLSRRVTGDDEWSAELVARFAFVCQVDPGEVLHHCTEIGAQYLGLKDKRDMRPYSRETMSQDERDALIQLIRVK